MLRSSIRTRVSGWIIAAIIPLMTALSGCASTPPAPTLLAYELYGTGPNPVIVLHDWLGDHQNYNDVRPYLDTKTFTYAFVDLRGYGGSKSITGAFNEKEASADTLRVADQLGWQRFHIIGHSMTGMVVQRIAADAPGRIISVIATSPVAASGMHTDAKTRAFLEGAARDAKVTAQAIQALTGNRLSEVWANFKTERAMAISTETARLGYLDMFDRADFHKDVEGLKVPITVILGENDLAFFQPDFIKGTFGKWYPNLKIVSSPNAGHYPMQETPVFYASTVDAHLKANVLK